MKKIFLLVCFFTVAYSYSFAQEYSYGFTGGVAISKVRDKVPGKATFSDSRTGFTIGAFYEYSYNKHFSFQPALNFVTKGGKGSNDNITFDYKFNYLEVPLNFLYYFKGKSCNFFFGAGPWFSAAVSGKATTDNGSGAKSKDLKFGNNDAKDDFKTFDIGADAVIGCKMKSGFLVSAGYSPGIHSINFHGDKLMNYYYSFKIGYTLASKKMKQQ